jgi:hypothetical protein
MTCDIPSCDISDDDSDVYISLHGIEDEPIKLCPVCYYAYSMGYQSGSSDSDDE